MLDSRDDLGVRQSGGAALRDGLAQLLAGEILQPDAAQDGRPRRYLHAAAAFLRKYAFPFQIIISTGDDLGIGQQLLGEPRYSASRAPALSAPDAMCARIWPVSCSWIGTGESCCTSNMIC